MITSMPYRHSALTNIFRQNKGSRNVYPLLSFNTRYRQRLCAYYCCEKRSTCGHCDNVPTAPILAEALAASARYGDVMTMAKRSTEAFYLGCVAQEQSMVVGFGAFRPNARAQEMSFIVVTYTVRLLRGPERGIQLTFCCFLARYLMRTFSVHSARTKSCLFSQLTV